MKVQAMVAYAPNTALVREELEPAGLRDDKVLIEIMASGLCHTDLSQLARTTASYPFPIMVGHEGAGSGRAVGASITSVKVGGHAIPLASGECEQCGNCLSGKTNLCAVFLGEIASQPTPISLRA